MKIREATMADFEELYAISANTPEFVVSATEPFMDKDDFKLRINNPKHVFLLAEKNKKIVGFICINAKDINSSIENKYACIVYVMVLPEFRKNGVAQMLYLESEKILKNMGITNIYSWANSEGDGGIINFFKKNGLVEGHKYVWMDKKL